MDGNDEGEEESARKPPPEECECEEGAPAWVVTFGDLMSLLLTFFVLLLSFSRMDDDEEQEGSVSNDASESGGAESDLESLAAAAASLADALEGSLENALDVEEDATGYIIRLDGSAVFDQGQGTLRPEGVLLLRALQPAVLGFGGEILVEGHTDDKPFPGRGPGVDDGNWQLSYDRAHSVVRHLHEQLGIGLSRIGVVARGPSRPRASNKTEEGRAQNRRVEIVLLKPMGERGPTVQMADAKDAPGKRRRSKTKRPPTARQSGETVIPEANFSPLEKAGYSGGPRGLFPD